VRILLGWQKEAANIDKCQDKWHSHWKQWTALSDTLVTTAWRGLG
jgi:hypothetical protein